MYWIKNRMRCCDIAFLYERLSRDDDVEGESNSIANQNEICQGVFLQKNTKI